MEVFRLPLVSSLEMRATVHSSFSGRWSKDWVGNEGVSPSKAPGDDEIYDLVSDS